MRIRTLLAVYLGIAVLAYGGAVSAGSLGNDLKSALRNTERQLCRSMKLDGCRKTTAPKPEREKAKAAAQPKPAAKKGEPQPLQDTSGKTREKDAKLTVLKPRLKPGSLVTDAPAGKATPPAKVPDIAVAAPPHQADAGVRISPPVSAATPVEKKVEAASPKTPQDMKVVQARPPSPPQLPSTDCQRQLAELGVAFKPEAMQVSLSNCTVENPVRIGKVKTTAGEIEFPERPLLNCAFAINFTRWAREVAEPLAKTLMQSGVASINTGPGFDCRGRNGDASAKLSEHAIGNAVDIESLTLADGRRLHVKDVADASIAGHELLQALRTSACERFTTVLGPGSNSAHEEHFHFDLAVRRGGYRLCE